MPTILIWFAWIILPISYEHEQNTNQKGNATKEQQRNDNCSERGNSDVSPKFSFFGLPFCRYVSVLSHTSNPLVYSTKIQKYWLLSYLYAENRAKEIKFNIKLLIDDKEQLVTASTSAKSCSVGAFLARLVHLRQVHPLSMPPFASAVRSDSVRRPIGFRPPSDRFPFAVRLDSVRRRWKIVGKNVARTLCSTAILSATSPSFTWAYFVVFIIRTLTICVFLWNLWENTQQ